ncbi:MAG: YdcF family protein [Bacteroidia bacterium]
MKEAPYDVIIVPGCPYNGKDWSLPMKGRVIWASYLVNKGIAKNVIFSGAAVYTPYVEGKVMAIYAESLGVAKEKIYVEDKAEHSTENIYNSYMMAKKLGFKKIAVASDQFQSNLLMRFTRIRFDLPIAHIPFVVDTLSRIDDVHPVIDATSARVENFDAFKPITQTQSARYRRRGTFGKHIKFESRRHN